MSLLQSANQKGLNLAINIKQVAHRATIAHLRSILNSFKVKDFSIGQGQLTPHSMLGTGQISNSSETI